tara:strand:+ start:197 stop:379 length:183 start_codon:yes stop_codon:yes gene_type:complete
MKMQFKLTDEFGRALVVGAEFDVKELTINGVRIVVEGEIKVDANAELISPTEQRELPPLN